ncbi:MAG: substrate-binding domain-containing protein, partial [Lachnospiraceae bacterium]|nr:substrate-binding domain-containing protein [Lachnospiraceae bacterium]
SRQTLRKALTRLKEEHIVESRQGSGYTLTGLYPGRSNQIVILTESDEVYLYPLLLSRITRFFDRRHYQAAVIVTGGDTGREREALVKLLQAPPRGLIAWLRNSALPSPNAPLYQALSDAGTALVFPAGRYPNLRAGKTSLPDNEQGGYLLTQHIITLGHSAVAMFLYAGDIAGQERYLGYCRAMTEHALPLRDDLILRLQPSIFDQIRRDHTGKQMEAILSLLPPDTSALLCQNDELAFSAMRAFEKKGLQIPGAMSIAGFDNSHLRTAGARSLTTMRRTPRQEAQAICETMLEQISTRQTATIIDTWELVKGSSSGRYQE